MPTPALLLAMSTFPAIVESPTPHDAVFESHSTFPPTVACSRESAPLEHCSTCTLAPDNDLGKRPKASQRDASAVFCLDIAADYHRTIFRSVCKIKGDGDKKTGAPPDQNVARNDGRSGLG